MKPPEAQTGNLVMKAPAQHFFVALVGIWFDAMAEYTQVIHYAAQQQRGKHYLQRRWHLLPKTELAREWLKAASLRENKLLRTFDEKISNVSRPKYGFWLAVLLPLETAQSWEEAHRAAVRQSKRLEVFYKPALKLYHRGELTDTTAALLYYSRDADLL